MSPTVTPSKVIHGRSPAPVLRTSASSAQLGNLDSEILVQSNYRVEDSSEITPKEKLIAKIKGVKPVDVLEAEIREEITAFPDSKIPARVVVTSGRLKGAVLIGEATLEKNSKKVSINFKELVSPRDHDPYPISGYALVEGEHHTNEGKFFLAEFLAAGAAGFADASISRSQNMYGNYVDEPSLDTSGKKALGSALNKSAERYAEKSRNAPEYTVISPYSTLQVLLTD
ncbi:hypothetical protein [Bdellovibrio sp. NC01]|uniref:hypothetical protein n=1 Tax=Bdellovibrio sp. NC01 TaxID=2220073 RepID=UPI00143D5E18|nr:hypothetical protein [Bdellovibrio sp. NC01]